MTIDKMAKTIIEAVKHSENKGTQPYDTTAEVIRVEGDTAWVYISGGVSETPVKKTINCFKGDIVQVRVGGGSAWITGNESKPPTDDAKADVANETAITASKRARTAFTTAENAQTTASNALNKANQAQTSADGKNTIYYGSTQPTGGSIGDTWFNEAEDNAIYRFNGTTWVKAELGEDAIADLAITNAKIGNLDAGKITSGTINVNRLNVSQIISTGDIATNEDLGVVASDLEQTTEMVNNTLIYDHVYEYNVDNQGKKISATFTAYLYRAGVDVKSSFEPSCFSWYLKKEDTDGQTKEVLLGTGYTITVSLANCGYGAEVIGKCTIADDAELLNFNNANLLTASSEPLSVRSSGSSVRLQDLTVSSTIFPTEKILIAGASEEHLITIQTLQDYLNLNLDKQVLFDSTAGWSNQTSLVSETDHLYVYTDYQTDSGGNAIAGIKVGDGNAYVVDLPFIDAIAMEHIADTTIHITDAERTAWNNKVRCYYAGTENLIFTTA